MNHWAGMDNAWFINMPFWVPAVLLVLAPFALLFVVWSIIGKGLALWHSARRGEYWWFIILLVINTLGILELIYLFFVAKLHWRDLFSKNSGGHGHDHNHGHDHHHA
ncbi:MAG TPA: DUF5652 family protein [Candidatus Paceibacterota bacterium]|nr:DUF5652 family protein [Candidatus Paceibacterota bacterium]